MVLAGGVVREVERRAILDLEDVEVLVREDVGDHPDGRGVVELRGDRRAVATAADVDAVEATRGGDVPRDDAVVLSGWRLTDDAQGVREVEAAHQVIGVLPGRGVDDPVLVGEVPDQAGARAGALEVEGTGAEVELEDGAVGLGDEEDEVRARSHTRLHDGQWVGDAVTGGDGLGRRAVGERDRAGFVVAGRRVRRDHDASAGRVEARAYPEVVDEEEDVLRAGGPEDDVAEVEDLLASRAIGRRDEGVDPVGPGHVDLEGGRLAEAFDNEVVAHRQDVERREARGHGSGGTDRCRDRGPPIGPELDHRGVGREHRRHRRTGGSAAGHRDLRPDGI